MHISFRLFAIVALKLLIHCNDGFLTFEQHHHNFVNAKNGGTRTIHGTDASIGIVGAGFAGLSAFNRLAELGFSNVHLFEANLRVGGRVYPLEFEAIFLQQGAEFVNGVNNPMYEVASRLCLITGEVEDYELISRDALFLSNADCEIPVEKFTKFVDFTMELEMRYAKLASNRPDLWAFTVAELFAADFAEFLERENSTIGNARRQFDMLARIYRTYYEGEWSAPVDELALHNYAQWRDGSTKSYPNSSFTLNHLGYAPILAELSARIPRDRLHLGTRVVHIDYRGTTTSLWTENRGHSSRWHSNFDFIIVTVPIGHLKRFGRALFTPKLPSQKLEAIDAIGFGAMQKVFFVYDKPFWEANVSSLVLLNCQNDSGVSVVLPDPGMEYLHTLQPHPWVPNRVLVAWLSGNGPKLVNGLSDRQLADGFTRHLRTLLPNHMNEIEMPRQIIRSKWLADELFLGSYTFITPEASQLATDPFALLAAPVFDDGGGSQRGRQRLRVLFAGEGTHSTMYQTTSGAFLSGRREANRLAKFIMKMEAVVKVNGEKNMSLDEDDDGEGIS